VSLTLYFDEDAAEQALVQALRSRGLRVFTPQEVGLLGAGCSPVPSAVLRHLSSGLRPPTPNSLAAGPGWTILILLKNSLLLFRSQ
jgi:hypothetical protein